MSIDAAGAKLVRAPFAIPLWAPKPKGASHTDPHFAAFLLTKSDRLLEIIRTEAPVVSLALTLSLTHVCSAPLVSLYNHLSLSL